MRRSDIKHLFAWTGNQRAIFAILIVLISLPNVLLFFTEQMPLLSKICNIVLPASVFWMLFTFAKKPGKMFWILFLFIFFDAFQVVLLYLFGKSVIAVDMFLNVVTSNSTEIEELLDNLIPALVIVLLLYGTAIFLAVRSCLSHETLSPAFQTKQRKMSVAGVAVGLALLLANLVFVKGFSILNDIYPVNVSYNLCLAVERQLDNSSYFETSKDFTFGAVTERPNTEREIYVLVVGETARADNLGIYGYERNTTPGLMSENNVIAYTDALTESNTTHKSVPMILSAVSAECIDNIYSQKGIITAYKEAGFHTIFISNQRPNHAFIDFFGEEAADNEFIKEELPPQVNVYDHEMLDKLSKKIEDSKADKIFVVLHMYGSHFNYKERYPLPDSYFKPDSLMSAKPRNREMLVNAYDNTIRYTDQFLKDLIEMLKSEGGVSAMVYTSDHGEDIYDDERRLFLHASPKPSYYQIHVPLIFWASDSFVQRYPDMWGMLDNHKSEAVSTNKVIFHTILEMSGVETPLRTDSISLVNRSFKEARRWYLDDHNEAIAIDELGLSEYDIRMFKKKNMKFQ